MTGLVGGTLYSPSNHRRFEHWLWLPPGDGPFPLVVLLHGVYDAGGFVWWQQGLAHETAARLVQGGTVPPFALLMPSDTGAEHGSGYCDWHDGTAKAESYLVDELLPWAADELALAGLHVTGLSMGGYGAWLLALRHPGLFASASATSGFFDPRRLFDFVPEASARMWGDDRGREAHDVRTLVRDAPRRTGLRLALDCGRDDPLIEENRAMRDLLDSEGVAHAYAEHPGGHDWPYWRDRLEDHLRFHFGAGGALDQEGQR